MIEKERERERERERENSILCVVSYTCAGVDNDDDTNDDERKHESQRNIIIIFAAPNRKPISSHLSPLMTSYIESSLPLTPTLLLTFSVFHPPPPLSLLPFTLLASPSLRLRLICSTHRHYYVSGMSLARTYHSATRFWKANGGTARDSATMFSSSVTEQCSACLSHIHTEKHRNTIVVSAVRMGEMSAW